jgi:cell division protein FtsB
VVLGSLLRPIAITAALAGLAAYATIMLRGPQGLSALTSKHHEIRQMEEQNADLQRDIQAKRDRIERLKHDPSTQELEVRKRMKMQLPGETKFIVPDASAAPGSATQAP